MSLNLHKKISAALKFKLIKNKKHPTANTHLINLINHYNIDLVLDVGANNGGFGTALRTEGYKGDIHSFEPVSKTHHELTKITAQDAKWQVHKLALGETCSEQSINVTESSDLASFLDASEFGKHVYKQNLTVAHQEIVTVSTVDEFLANEIDDLKERKIFLKMDTQGYDTYVIKGASASMNLICCVLSEISFFPLYEGMPHYLESLNTYENLGLAVTGLYPISRKKDLSVIEMDCMLINKTNSHD
ncbi:MAG: FkbM family methyltransferase [Candidatus Endobugula sp.]|jgi:FkbM family methyltransferase